MSHQNTLLFQVAFAYKPLNALKQAFIVRACSFSTMDRSPQSDKLAGRKNARAQHQAQLSEHASAAPGDFWVCLHGLKYPSSDYTWGVAFACVQRNMDIIGNSWYSCAPVAEFFC